LLELSTRLKRDVVSVFPDRCSAVLKSYIADIYPVHIVCLHVLIGFTLPDGFEGLDAIPGKSWTC